MKIIYNRLWKLLIDKDMKKVTCLMQPESAVTQSTNGTMAINIDCRTKEKNQRKSAVKKYQ